MILLLVLLKTLIFKSLFFASSFTILIKTFSVPPIFSEFKSFVLKLIELSKKKYFHDTRLTKSFILQINKS